jgi:hypothetical protein
METQMKKTVVKKTVARSAYVAGGAILVSACLVLTGCGPTSAPSAGNPTSAQSPSSGESTTTGSTSLDGFPTDKVPLIDGQVVNAQHPGNTWGVWIASSDLKGDLAKATKLLTDAGYDKVIGTSSYADFHGTEYQVHVTAKVDPKYGSTILYSFYHVK